ncbi:TPA: V-type ATP synthase subunit A, partial [Candidatus Geothermarchaeota archaeon]|nr:V-type ATP synthase subunit A [Candidatus Geothermarchaeota archaeon]
YERAGRVKVLGRPERMGSVTVVGAVSPPGGDFNEPVTTHTLRFTGVFWALDADLAYSRHFPSIHWLKSYSLYADSIIDGYIKKAVENNPKLKDVWPNVEEEYPKYRVEAMDILTNASEVESIAKIIGEKALPDDQRLLLLTNELIKEGLLRQNAFDPVDAYSEPERSILILKAIIDFHRLAEKLVRENVPIDRVIESPIISKIKRVKLDEKKFEAVVELLDNIRSSLSSIAEEYRVTLSL